ncbi:MAG: major capsid protein [Candidatus Contendobacter sp.]|nr:major capsid protein [Candidatus Contendobacter sp.]MDG4556057.1 major capsid protein [Candidatus Contendobacter sp.]
MAVTQIADLVVKAEFSARVQVLSTTKSALFQSGIIANDPTIAALARSEGATFTLPYWNDVDGSSAVGSDDPNTTLTPGNITQGSETAIKLFRSKAWSAMDITKSILAGDDPLERVANLIAGWWSRDMQTILINSLTGIFASGGALVATHVHDVTGASTALSADVILDGKQKLGDAADDLTAIAMHSAKYTALQKALLIDYIGAEGDIRFPTFLGYRVIVDDSCPVNSGNYTTYLFGPGSVAYGEGMPKVPMAYTRNELAGNGAGQETLVNRREFILHPRGLRWTSDTMAGSSPTNAELATAANWEQAWADKAIKLVKILSK